jgi:hypothetical protein
MLSCYSSERKTINGGRNFFFHLFNLIVVNAHILYNKTNKKKMLLEIFYEKVAKGSLATASMEIQVQGQTSSLAGRLVERDHFLYGNPATHAKPARKSQRLCRVCADRSKCLTGKTVKKCTTTYCRKCDAGLCNGHHTKLNYWE